MKPTPLILAFDVFGTVVDWHGSISREVAALIPGEDGNAFATAWRAGYKPAMAEVRSGKLGWTKIDDLHRRILDQVLLARGHDLDEAKANEAKRLAEEAMKNAKSDIDLAKAQSEFATMAAQIAAIAKLRKK